MEIQSDHLYQSLWKPPPSPPSIIESQQLIQKEEQIKEQKRELPEETTIDVYA